MYVFPKLMTLPFGMGAVLGCSPQKKDPAPYLVNGTARMPLIYTFILKGVVIVVVFSIILSFRDFVKPPVFPDINTKMSILYQIGPRLLQNENKLRLPVVNA